MNIVCCDMDCHRIENATALGMARAKGSTEEEAHELALVGFWCENCDDWYKLENGWLRRDHQLSGKSDYYPVNGVKCFIFEED